MNGAPEAAELRKQKNAAKRARKAARSRVCELVTKCPPRKRRARYEARLSARKKVAA